MRDTDQPAASELWPFSLKWAIVFTTALWLGFAVAVVVGEALVQQPGAEIVKALVPVVLLTGSIPIVLILVQFIARRRGKVGFHDVVVDFGGATRDVQFFIPSNIGDQTPVYADSSALNITGRLAFGLGEPIARIDLGQTPAAQWWETRLLIVCARAVRLGRPSALVFTASVSGEPGSYIGWARPADLLDKLLEKTVDVDRSGIGSPVTFAGTTIANGPGHVTLRYGEIYTKACQIADALAGLEWLTTTNPAVVSPAQGAQQPTVPILTKWDAFDGPARYVGAPGYANLGVDALEPIILDQIGLLRLESAPRIVSAAEFTALFQSSLHPESIDLARPGKKQLDAFLGSTEPYIGIVNNGVFLRVATNRELQQSLLRSLVDALGGSE